MRTRNIGSGLVTIFLVVTQGRTQHRPELDLKVRIAVSDLRQSLMMNSREDLIRLYSDYYVARQVDELRKLIRKEILRQLNAGFESADELNTRLLPIIQQEGWKDPTSVFHWKWDGTDSVIVAYSILHGGYGVPDCTAVIEAFRKATDQYDFVAQTGDGMENSRVRVEAIPSPTPREFWMLAHGLMAGVMWDHEKIRIYNFDGRGFNELWATSPKRAPLFHIGKDSVEIAYGEEPETGSSSMIQTLALTHAGVVETKLAPKL